MVKQILNHHPATSNQHLNLCPMVASSPASSPNFSHTPSPLQHSCNRCIGQGPRSSQHLHRTLSPGVGFLARAVAATKWAKSGEPPPQQRTANKVNGKPLKSCNSIHCLFGVFIARLDWNSMIRGLNSHFRFEPAAKKFSLATLGVRIAMSLLTKTSNWEGVMAGTQWASWSLLVVAHKHAPWISKCGLWIGEKHWVHSKDRHCTVLSASQMLGATVVLRRVHHQ